MSLPPELPMNNKDYCPHCALQLTGYEGEEWKWVVGYEGFYWVSSFGRVKAVSRRNSYGNILTLTSNRCGYGTVRLTRNKGSTSFLIHRLVAQAFIPNPFNYSEVNHKDANKINNRVENLEWCNHASNMKHAAKMNLMPTGSKNHNAKLNEKSALKIKTRLKKGDGPTWLAKEFKVSMATIQAIRDGKAWRKVEVK